MTTDLAERIADGSAPGQHVVYLLEGADGGLVYVGRSAHLVNRLRGHRSASEWWPQVVRGWWYPCQDAVEARLVERESIARYRPAANIVDVQPVRAAQVQLPKDAEAALRALFDAAYGAVPESLPQRRLNAYILALRQAGWTLQAIGTPVGYTREAIRLRERRAVPMGGLPPVPRVPPKPAQARRVRKTLRVRPEIAEYLREMAAVARTVRGWTPLDAPSRAVSVDYTEALALLHLQGVTVGELARSVGVTHYAIRSRLARHGYFEFCPSVRGVRFGTTAAPRTECLRGHALTGDNVRFINGDPTRRVCRACDRIRVGAYRARKAAA